MATLTIQVEDRSVMAGLKKVLESMKGVVIVPNHQKKTGIEEAMDDIRKRLRVYTLHNSKKAVTAD